VSIILLRLESGRRLPCSTPRTKTCSWGPRCWSCRRVMASAFRQFNPRMAVIGQAVQQFRALRERAAKRAEAPISIFATSSGLESRERSLNRKTIQAPSIVRPWVQSVLHLIGRLRDQHQRLRQRGWSDPAPGSCHARRNLPIAPDRDQQLRVRARRID
jgi:hypothetical protein